MLESNDNVMQSYSNNPCPSHRHYSYEFFLSQQHNQSTYFKLEPPKSEPVPRAIFEAFES